MQDRDNTASQQARRHIEAMYAQDACAQEMGMHIEHIDTGFARLSMKITPNMLNGHQSCHGGILFSLADTAFAYACNSEGLAAVASSGSIDFIRPALAGDHLTATASVQYQGKTTGLYDVEITNQNGKPVAFFRGHSHRLSQPILTKGDQS
ncbi:hydroxyphenylacetyl-CoA thioesterase PaaI [Xenorhabdus sp. DI]|uniref:hydroxyphenylacetyl-CoA thioesterase PaaI n=1 Tax=Xenorhabdus doucetiae TaxID=351671 RepID=UPI0019859EBB|nr:MULTISPECIES: hydroxyphenylacetyl-CoA thioesterase PaaI [unclassified Xenorhabdus]MBD2784566.1 hydroxyphenylacetyl-CoA thioesterase PaaI [Xenorhabdus sp. 3]MBD2788337.1 hydroxyphenylacetyl-CoA thioesterase PaaI [Xenorhabdus sp. DI]